MTQKGFLISVIFLLLTIVVALFYTEFIIKKGSELTKFQVDSMAKQEAIENAKIEVRVKINILRDQNPITVYESIVDGCEFITFRIWNSGGTTTIHKPKCNNHGND